MVLYLYLYPYPFGRYCVVFATESTEASYNDGPVCLPTRVEKVSIRCVVGAWLLPLYWQGVLSSVW